MSQRYIGGLIYNPPGGFSGLFDGSGDYLSAPDNAAWYFTGDFTVECWAYWSSVSSSEANVLAQHRPASAANQAIEFWSNATTLYLAYSSSSVTTTIAANQWYHLAMSCTSGTASCYVNGVRIGTFSMPTRIDSADPFTIGARTGSGGSGATGFFTGYISNVRVINGTGIYSGASFDPPVGPLQAITNTSLLTCAYPTFRDGSTNNFTITVNGNTAVSAQNPFPQTQLPNPALGNQGNGVYSMSQYQALRSQNLWPAIDPYFDYVTLMLHGNGTNGAQNNTFLDSSTNNFTITRNGNTTQGTFAPYGANWSNYFVDSSSSYLNIASSSIVNFGTSDFTAEAWVNLNALDTSIDTIISNYNNGSNGGLGWYINRGTNGGIQVYSGNSLVVSASSAVTAGTWNHIAICRASGTTRIFVNGAIAASASDSSNYGADNSATGIGGTPPGSGAGAYLPGYLSNVRVVKGTALYTSAFTPSTSPLTAISGTSLLTCQSNRFIDNSSNNFTITRNGDVSVQRFSPFAPTTPYAAGTIGGSGYFDGSGDYLACGSSNTAVSFGTGDFTIEAWVYWNSIASESAIMFGNGVGWTFYIFPANKLQWGRTSPQTPANLLTGNTTLSTGQWYHIAVTRSGTTVTLWVNGVSDGTVTDSANYSASGDLRVGISHSSNYFNGYMSNVRVVKGTAVYTSAFTPPSAPLTAITNTSILLNFTNGGIIDNAMMNDLETVGNAQISTSVSKFGGGSLAFDGSGDYLICNTTPSNYVFGTGDFTIEMWINTSTVSPSYQGIWDSRTADPSVTPHITLVSGAPVWWVSGSARITGATLVTSTWYHLAVVRSSGTTKMYLNGTQTGSSYTDSNNYTSRSSPTIGMNFDVIWPFTGYIDDLRITKYARYTANFTPQRSQWQDQ